jgi:hypothetical protein
MTPQEIQERNKQIALMLGKKYENNCIVIHCHNVCGVNPSGETWQECSFHSDWNWLMEAVEFIEKLSVYHMVETNRSSCVIYNGKNIITANYFKADKTKKEAVFIAVSDFAQKLNNKEL